MQQKQVERLLETGVDSVFQLWEQQCKTNTWEKGSKEMTWGPRTPHEISLRYQQRQTRWEKIVPGPEPRLISPGITASSTCFQHFSERIHRFWTLTIWILFLLISKEREKSTHNLLIPSEALIAHNLPVPSDIIPTGIRILSLIGHLLFYLPQVRSHLHLEKTHFFLSRSYPRCSLFLNF